MSQTGTANHTSRARPSSADVTAAMLCWPLGALWAALACGAVAITALPFMNAITYYGKARDAVQDATKVEGCVWHCLRGSPAHGCCLPRVSLCML